MCPGGKGKPGTVRSPPSLLPFLRLGANPCNPQKGPPAFEISGDLDRALRLGWTHASVEG